jgi:hypothetical protein
MKISYAKTILELTNNTDFTIYNDNLDNIIWHNNNPTNITKEQILNKQIELQSIEDLKPENINRQSALNKLSALGLTEAEIKAIIGIT